MSSKDKQKQEGLNIELGIGKGIFMCCYVKIGFQQRDRLNNQEPNEDSLYKTPSSFPQCKIRTEKNPEAGRNLDYRGDKYCQSYGQLVSCFNHLTKDDILQPNISQKDFLPNNVKARDRNTEGIGNYSFVFDIRY